MAVVVLAAVGVASAWAARRSGRVRVGALLVLVGAAACAGMFARAGELSIFYPVTEPSVDAQGSAVRIEDPRADLRSDPAVALAHQKYHLMATAGIMLAASAMLLLLGWRWHASPDPAASAVLVGVMLVAAAPHVVANVLTGPVHDVWGPLLAAAVTTMGALVHGSARAA